MFVRFPGEKGEKEILEILLRVGDVAESVNLDEAAKRTGGFSGFDLKRASSGFPDVGLN